MQAVRRRGVPNAVTSTLSLQKKTRGAFTTFRLTSRGVYQCAARSYAGGRRAAPSRARTPPATAIIISHKCARATASGPPRLPPARARRVPLFQRPESFFRRPRPRLAAVAATARHVLCAALATRAYLDQGRVGLGRPAVEAHARANQSSAAVFSRDPEATLGLTARTGSNAPASPIRWGRPTRPLPHALDPATVDVTLSYLALRTPGKVARK